MNDSEALKEQCRTLLDKYEVPRYVICVEKLPLTETGKPARAEAKMIAKKLFKR